MKGTRNDSSGVVTAQCAVAAKRVAAVPWLPARRSCTRQLSDAVKFRPPQQFSTQSSGNERHCPTTRRAPIFASQVLERRLVARGTARSMLPHLPGLLMSSSTESGTNRRYVSPPSTGEYGLQAHSPQVSEQCCARTAHELPQHQPIRNCSLSATLVTLQSNSCTAFWQ
jgi:hypothetical protein